MKEFEVLRVTPAIIYENQFVLRVYVKFGNEFISFRYELNSEQKWIFQGNFLLYANSHGNNSVYHSLSMRIKKAKGTFEEFKKTMEKLAPEILNDPKVRIKSVLYK